MLLLSSGKATMIGSGIARRSLTTLNVCSVAVAARVIILRNEAADVTNHSKCYFESITPTRTCPLVIYTCKI